MHGWTQRTPRFQPCFLCSVAQPSSAPALPAPGCPSPPLGCHVFQVPVVTSGTEQGEQGASGHDEQAFRGGQCRGDPAASSRGHSGCRAAKGRGGFSIPGTFCPFAKLKVRLHFRCPGTWRRLLVWDTYLLFNCIRTSPPSPTNTERMEREVGGGGRGGGRGGERGDNVRRLEKSCEGRTESDDLARLVFSQPQSSPRGRCPPPSPPRWPLHFMVLFWFGPQVL